MTIYFLISEINLHKRGENFDIFIFFNFDFLCCFCVDFQLSEVRLIEMDCFLILSMIYKKWNRRAKTVSFRIFFSASAKVTQGIRGRTFFTLFIKRICYTVHGTSSAKNFWVLMMAVCFRWKLTQWVETMAISTFGERFEILSPKMARRRKIFEVYIYTYIIIVMI